MDRKIKVMSVFGTRPEAVKMAPVVRAVQNHPDLQSVVAVTAQHREMLDQVLAVFDIHPDYDLNIMQAGQTLTQITTRAMNGLEQVFIEAKPDIVLVHGDTTTSFAGALAAFYQQIPVGHVEAGLRTFNKYEPFPEEMNRCLTGRLAELHFSPTENSKRNLLAEGIAEDIIFVTGNTVIDALQTTIKEEYTFEYDLLNHLDYTKKIITMTAHRRENLGEPLHQICRAIRHIIEANENVEVVYAVHLNPKVQETAKQILGDLDRVHLIPPLALQDMHNLMNRSYLVLTDSGGLQEEVPSMGKPVLVLRNVTERPEGVEAGTLKLVGTDFEVITRETEKLLHDPEAYHKMATAVNPYGDGKAAGRIAAVIADWFVKKEN
ncbi:UDP-N-acetylglucosamine 2-epimerase (non-hydrolyzing) [Clostridiales bacterium COT073_COT-073]|nr:UDP-N-acetylglucosamine 2-epimerase (non-hydrolyzing) [Clostridiales bacterium COT073_COT-073]